MSRKAKSVNGFTDKHMLELIIQKNLRLDGNTDLETWSIYENPITSQLNFDRATPSGDSTAFYVDTSGNVTFNGTTSFGGGLGLTGDLDMNTNDIIDIGNVGIGTETPAETLHLYGNTGTLRIEPVNNSLGTNVGGLDIRTYWARESGYRLTDLTDTNKQWLIGRDYMGGSTTNDLQMIYSSDGGTTYSYPVTISTAGLLDVLSSISINGTSVLTSTTLGSGIVNSSLTSNTGDLVNTGNLSATGNLNLSTTKTYQIGGIPVLSETTLQSGIINSSLQNLGTQNTDLNMGTNNITNATSITSTNLTGTLQTASQPNITSTGTLTGLTMGGTLDMNGNVITNMDTANIRELIPYTTNNILLEPVSLTPSWIRSRTGGTPTTEAGLIFSSFSNSHWFNYNLNGTYTLGYSTENNNTSPDVTLSTNHLTLDTSGNLDISGGYEIGGTSVLNSTTLGTGIINSSLQNLGTQNTDLNMGTNNITNATSITSTNLTGTLQTASQPNITSTGTLTGLTLSGNLDMGTNNITNATSITATNLTGTLQTASQPNITSTGTLSSLTITGDLDVDGTTFNIDSANDRVGIGINALTTGARTIIRFSGSSTYDKHTSGNTLLCQSDTQVVNQLATDDAARSFSIYTGGSKHYLSGREGSDDTYKIGYRTSSGDAILTTGYTTLLSIDNTGSTTITGDLNVDSNTLFVDASSDNVGIGTATPSTSLEIYDNSEAVIKCQHGTSSVGGLAAGMLIQSNATIRGKGIKMTTDADTNDIWLIGNKYNSSTANMNICYTSTGEGVNMANYSEYMTIDTSGNVGIGTNTPTEKVDVVGNVQAEEHIATKTSIISVGSLGYKLVALDNNVQLSTVSPGTQIVLTGNDYELRCNVFKLVCNFRFTSVASGTNLFVKLDNDGGSDHYQKRWIDGVNSGLTSPTLAHTIYNYAGNGDAVEIDITFDINTAHTTDVPSMQGIGMIKDTSNNTIEDLRTICWNKSITTLNNLNFYESGGTSVDIFMTYQLFRMI